MTVSITTLNRILILIMQCIRIVMLNVVNLNVVMLSVVMLIGGGADVLRTPKWVTKI